MTASTLFKIQVDLLPDHPVHFYAQVLVWGLLIERHGMERVHRHRERIVQAFKSLENIT